MLGLCTASYCTENEETPTEAKSALRQTISSIGTSKPPTNEKWLTDITEFQIPAGKVYLSPMIDCFDGLVVWWSVGPSVRVQTPTW